MHNNSEIDQKTQHFKNILLQMKQEDKEKHFITDETRG